MIVVIGLLQNGGSLIFVHILDDRTHPFNDMSRIVTRISQKH